MHFTASAFVVLASVLSWQLGPSVLVQAHQLHIKNSCPHTVWPAILADFGFTDPENGGFRLDSGDERLLDVEHAWGGKIWGRTGCDEDSGHCETGDCGDLIECEGFPGSPPFTFVEIKFDGIGDLDYYFLSLVDGYNLRMEIVPVPGTVEEGGGGGPFDCKPSFCAMDLNTFCPPELGYTRSDGGRDEPENTTDRSVSTGSTNLNSDDEVIACMSPCVAFNTDEYCCRGEYNSPERCRGEAWPINYTTMAKIACPNAFSYSYVHDPTTRQSTCRSVSANSSSYEILFCS